MAHPCPVLGTEVRLAACSIHVTLSDKGAQSTQINPSRSDGSSVPYFAIGVLLKLCCGVGHTRQFGLEFVLYVVAIGSVVTPLVELVSAELDLMVEDNINDVICID
jgi:hypothetical protein